MNASTILVKMASALTQTARSAVSVPWDTAWTLEASNVKVSLFSIYLSPCATVDVNVDFLPTRH